MPADAASPARIVRPALVALGVLQLALGVWALFVPRSFYGSFPIGRGWVELLPPYNEHLVRDVGGLYLTTAGVFLGAAVVMRRSVVVLACLSWLLFAVPHAAYHLLNLEPFTIGDAIANVGVLAGAIVLPVWVAWSARRRSSRPGRDRAAGGDGASTARIAGVPDSVRNPLIRASFRESRRRYGAVIAPLRVFAHHPTVLGGYAALELASQRARGVPARLKHLAELRAGMICGCEWCLDFGSAISADVAVDEDDLRDLVRYEDSPRFNATEKLALRYASAMSRSPVEVSDDLFEQLREHFDDAQLVELTSIIALENYRARFNRAFVIGSQGFSDGALCLLSDREDDRSTHGAQR